MIIGKIDIKTDTIVVGIKIAANIKVKDDLL